MPSWLLLAYLVTSVLKTGIPGPCGGGGGAEQAAATCPGSQAGRKCPKGAPPTGPHPPLGPILAPPSKTLEAVRLSYLDPMSPNFFPLAPYHDQITKVSHAASPNVM